MTNCSISIRIWILGCRLSCFGGRKISTSIFSSTRSSSTRWTAPLSCISRVCSMSTISTRCMILVLIITCFLNIWPRGIRYCSVRLRCSCWISISSGRFRVIITFLHHVCFNFLCFNFYFFLMPLIYYKLYIIFNYYLTKL